MVCIAKKVIFRAMEKQSIENAHVLAVKSGVSYNQIRLILYSDTTSIRFETLDGLSAALGVAPGNLITREK